MGEGFRGLPIIFFRVLRGLAGFWARPGAERSERSERSGASGAERGEVEEFSEDQELEADGASEWNERQKHMRGGVRRVPSPHACYQPDRGYVVRGDGWGPMLTPSR